MTSRPRPSPWRTALVIVPRVRRHVPAFPIGTLPGFPGGLGVGVLVVVVLGVALAVVAPVGPARADAGPGGVQVPDSPLGDGTHGPLTAADRDFVVRVRLAGLWEIPAGRMAAQKGVDPLVRQVGAEIAAQHVRLDELTRTAAARLGIALPGHPTYEQQGWLAEMQRAQGADFDHVFVLRLRAAHGLIFSAIAAVRAGTHNDVVRRLAQEANQFVMTHMTLLESTHLVDYADDVPSPPNPPPLHIDRPVPVQARSLTGGAVPLVIWAVLGLGLLAGVGAAARIVRPD